MGRVIVDEKSRIVQLIPATGWAAVFAAMEGEGEGGSHLYIQTVDAWALVEEEESYRRDVYAMVATTGDGALDIAAEDDTFLGLVRTADLVDKKPDLEKRAAKYMEAVKSRRESGAEPASDAGA